MNNALSPLKTIRVYCLDCCNGSSSEVRKCPVTRCPLYLYRFGKSLNRKPRSEEEGKKYAERFRKKTAPAVRA